MKLKRFNGMLAALAVICTQITAPALAAPNGDWTDTSELSPVYEAASTTLSAGGLITTDNAYGDFIIEFEVNFAAGDRFQFRKVVDESVKTLAYMQQNWVSANQAAGKHIQYLLSVNGATKNGWFAKYTDSDSDFPDYTAGHNVLLRFQTKGTTMSYWAADLGTAEEPVENPVYKYGGSHTQDEVAMVGQPQIYSMQAQTVKNLKVYSLEGAIEVTSSEISVKPGCSFDIEFSLEPQRALTAADFVLKDKEGNTVDAIGEASGSGKEYTVTLDDWLLYDTAYTLEVAAGVKTVQGYAISGCDFVTAKTPEYKLKISDVSVSEGAATVIVERNVNEKISTTVILAVYNVTDGAEECVDLIAQVVLEKEDNSFTLTFTDVADGQIVRAYALDGLDTISSMAVPCEN
ncbi:MAG: hypothetical protein J6C82_07835 [Clostridia bacterium]|nr:hypothetical protein [Clostridia bacterium]